MAKTPPKLKLKSPLKRTKRNGPRVVHIWKLGLQLGPRQRCRLLTTSSKSRSTWLRLIWRIYWRVPMNWATHYYLGE